MRQEIEIVGTGIDTIKINVKVLDDEGQVLPWRSLAEDFLGQLQVWQEHAIAKGEPIPTSMTFHEVRMMMYPNGAPSWKYILRNDCLEVKVIPRLKVPMVAKVTVLSEYLWKLGDTSFVLDEVKGFLSDVFGKQLVLQAAQIDLCVDVVGLVLPTEWEQVFITHAIGKRPFSESQKDSAYYHGRHLETILFSGHGRPVNCKLYNKTLEIEQKSKKTWMYDQWKEKGWDYERWKAAKQDSTKKQENGLEVRRIEFSLERAGLHQMELESIEETLRNVKRLWEYCTHEWLRMVEPGRTKNRTRWGTQPVWKTVQHAFDAYGNEGVDGLGPLVRQRKRQKNIEAGIAAIAGYATTLAAWYEKDWETSENCIDALFALLRTEVTARWEDLGVTPQELIRVKKFIYHQKP